MKKIFLLTAMAVMVLASCNRNEEEMGKVSGEKAHLSIRIKSPKTYATTTDFATDAADEVENFNVFITDQTNEIKWWAYSDDGSEIEDLEVSTQAKHVYVVANTGEDLTADGTGDITITSMAELIAFRPDLAAADTEEGSQTTMRWATGRSVAPLHFDQNGNDFKAETTVTLTFVAARITVTIATSELMADHYPDSGDGSLDLTHVAVLNARGESMLFSSDDITDDDDASLVPGDYTDGKKYYEGIADNSFAYYPDDEDDFTVDATLLSDGIGAYNDVQKKFTNTFYYYVFENDATTAAAFPTIVTIKGTYKGQDIYFPVHLAPYEQFSTSNASDLEDGLLRGHSYDITITLTGDPRSNDDEDYPGGTGGTDDPTDPVISAFVDVSVELNTWVPVVLGKTF